MSKVTGKENDSSPLQMRSPSTEASISREPLLFCVQLLEGEEIHGPGDQFGEEEGEGTVELILPEISVLSMYSSNIITTL